MTDIFIVNPAFHQHPKSQAKSYNPKLRQAEMQIAKTGSNAKIASLKQNINFDTNLTTIKRLRSVSYFQQLGTSKTNRKTTTKTLFYRTKLKLMNNEV